MGLDFAYNIKCPWNTCTQFFKLLVRYVVPSFFENLRLSLLLLSIHVIPECLQGSPG